jgi:hypothetical protein
MIAGRHANATRVLGAPLDWDEAMQGHCGGLAVCDHLTKAGLVMESAWLPTQEELTRLVAGAPVILGVMGLGHPPVYLAVGEPPDETPPDAVP